MTKLSEPWFDIRYAGGRLGAGVLLMQCFAITAYHCIRGVPEGGVVDILGANGWAGAARILDKSEHVDLALLEVTLPAGVSTTPTLVDGSKPGESWFGPCRPSRSDPHVEGEVSTELDYECAAGGQVKALQLDVRPTLGDYSGYSGGPVHRKLTSPPIILGMLFEQYPDRAQNRRNADVLFAISIYEVWRHFKHLAIPSQLNKLDSVVQRLTSSVEPTLPPVEIDWSDSHLANRVEEGIRASQKIGDYIDSLQLEPDKLQAARIRIANSLIDHAFRRGA